MNVCPLLIKGRGRMLIIVVKIMVSFSHIILSKTTDESENV